MCTGSPSKNVGFKAALCTPMVRGMCCHVRRETRDISRDLVHNPKLVKGGSEKLWGGLGWLSGRRPKVFVPRCPGLGL